MSADAVLALDDNAAAWWLIANALAALPPTAGWSGMDSPMTRLSR